MINDKYEIKLNSQISLKMTSYMDKVLFGIIIDYE